MNKEFPYWVVAYYWIGSLEDPALEAARHREFFAARDVKCRIYLSSQGINGQMSARKDHAEEIMRWLHSDPRFATISFKVHGSREQVFPKTTIKVRRQLVAMDREVDLSRRGEPVAPAVWKRMLEEKDESTILIDVRNDYEWDVGHFEGAEKPGCDTFREFPSYAEQLKQKVDPAKARILMYCTGGIRCEFYSALMKEKGFENVYQLEGGVIGYGLQQGSEHWKGKLFVFDDRLVVPIADDASAPISRCRHCNSSSDVYYNCANMDCNELFLCCPLCLQEHKGCCSKECVCGRLRPYHQDGSSKPFRKWSYEEKRALQRETTPCPS